MADLLEPGEARARILAAAVPLRGIEACALDRALGRVLAETLRSTVSVPPLDNSAMDGYAVASRECGGAEVRLRVAQRIAAGSVGVPLAPGTAARIFTGAPVPPGSDAVLMQEDCRVEGDMVIFPGPVDAGRNVRRAGEDIADGALILSSGQRLRPAELGLAASIGRSRLQVVRRPRVAMLCTGDELVEPGEPLPPGRIYNSNRATLRALLVAQGCEVIDLGPVEDTLEATRTALERAAPAADLVLSTGGVSVGEEDHVRAAVQAIGRLDLWKIAIKPGKPLAFGAVGDTPFIGLPGNPVSMFVTYLLFVAPFVARRQGMPAAEPVPLPVPAGFDRPRPGPRTEYLRVRLERDAEGRAVAALFPNQSSGVLTSMAWASGLAIMRPGRPVRRGDAVEYLPLDQLLA